MTDFSYSIGIYVRESRDENEENYETIEVQRDLLINFANKASLGTIYKVYMDDNISGSVFERKGIEMLKEDVVSGKIDLILLKDLSRLGRNNAKTLLFLDFLEEHGVRVLTYDGRYDSIRDNDTVGIDTWFNERYIRDISKKIRTSMRYRIERGDYIGSAPFGYTKSLDLKNKLCINEQEAIIIREIFDLYRSGLGYASISKILNSKGYLSPSSMGTWNATAVKRILCNAVYTGDTVQGVSEKISFKSKKTRRLPRDKWVITKDTHKAIISREEFDEVQKIREGKNDNSGEHKGEIHLFKDVLYCGKCFTKMFARKRKDRPLGYVCSTYAKKGGAFCTSHHIKEGFLKNIVCGEIVECLKDSKHKEDLIVLLNNDMKKETETGDYIKQMEHLLISKQKQQDVLYMDKLDGKISDQLFSRINSNIENRICQIRHELEKAKNILSEKIEWNEIIEEFINGIRNDGLTNQMIKVLVSRITVYEKGEYTDKWIMPSADNGEDEGVVMIEYNFKRS